MSRAFIIIAALLCKASSFVALPLMDVKPGRGLELTKKQIRRKVRRQEKRQRKKQVAKEQQVEPTISPSSSSKPSNQPSSSPVALPYTFLPSLAPITTEPTSALLTGTPSYSPSPIPTTTQPSRRPSVTPTTNAPTRRPSTSPSQSPTLLFSESPSSAPSLAPSSWPSSYPSTRPTSSLAETTISCNGKDTIISRMNGLSLAIIRFRYEVQYKPSATETEAIMFAEASIAQIVANEFLPCNQNTPERRLGESSSFNLVAVDYLPADTASYTETCKPEKPKWSCAVVNGAITIISEDGAVFNVYEIRKVIEDASLDGDLNLPNQKSRVTYLAQSEELQHAPASPVALTEREPSSTTPSPPRFVYGIAVAAAFVGAAAFALFIYFRYRRPTVTARLKGNNTENNMNAPEQHPNALPSDAGSEFGGASYLSDDTFWRTILSKRPESNSRAQEEASDASIALSSIGVSFRGALGDGLEDDIDVESYGSDTVGDPCPSCTDDDGITTRKGKGGKKWIDRLGILADPE